MDFTCLVNGWFVNVLKNILLAVWESVMLALHGSFDPGAATFLSGIISARHAKRRDA